MRFWCDLATLVEWGIGIYLAGCFTPFGVMMLLNRRDKAEIAQSTNEALRDTAAHLPK